MSDAVLIRHLSPTKIETGLKCGEMMKFRYEEKVPEPSVGILHAGRVVHAIIERALKRFLLNGSYPDWKEMDDHYQPEWEAKVKQEEEKATFLGWQWEDNDPEEKVRRECRALIPFVRTEILPGLKPRLVEHEVKQQYQSEIGPFLVWGYMDLLEQNGVLADWKTTAKVSKNAKASWMQLAFYSKDVSELTGAQNVPARKIFLIRDGRPDVEVVNYQMTPAHREWAAKSARAVWKMTQTRAWSVPLEGSAWWCSERFCSFWGMCKGPIMDGVSR